MSREWSWNTAGLSVTARGRIRFLEGEENDSPNEGDDREENEEECLNRVSSLTSR